MIVGMGLRGRPAHAEVYLSTSATPGQWKCSPRVRGGLPRNHAYLGTKSGIAPCTRGFTRPPTWCGKRSKGRPVYAGVYRDTRIAAEPREEVAPCTRGFTARPEHSVNKTGGRPVYAGVYPARLDAAQRCPRSPRIRGVLPGPPSGQDPRSTPASSADTRSSTGYSSTTGRPWASQTRNRAGKPWLGSGVAAVKPRRTKSGTIVVRAGRR